MPANGFYIKKIYIKQFKSLSDLTLEPSGELSEFSMPSAEAAGDVCGFVRGMLYGDGEMKGFIEIETDGVTVKIASDGEDRIVVPPEALEGAATPGEALTGLDADVFGELFNISVDQGETRQIPPENLDACLKRFGAPEGLFSSIEKLDREKERFTNKNGDGESDLAIARHRELTEKCDAVHLIGAKRAELENQILSYDERLDENAKRSIILKADMKNYTDDIKLLENRENASQLKNEIQANEKKLRIFRYEAEKEIPLPQPGELSDIKRLYSEFSRVKAELSDSANQLVSARENLEFHKKIFDHEDFDADSVLKQYDTINRNRKRRFLFLILTGVFALAAVVTFIVLTLNPGSKTLFDALVGLSVFIVGLICFVISDIFSKKTEIILDKLKIRTKKEFDGLHEKLNAHRKTEVLYTEQVTRCEKQCSVFTRLSDDCLDKLRRLLSYTGLDLGSSQDVSNICDRLISNCDTISELERQIDQQKQTYNKMLKNNVEKEELVVSKEFAALERELDFVNRQNASLMSKKASVNEQLAALDEEEKKIEEFAEELAETDRKIEALSKEYNAVCSKQNPLLRQAKEVREKLSGAICPTADKLLANILRPGEQFSLSKRMLPQIVLDGKPLEQEVSRRYLSQMASLVYRLMLSMVLLKKCPLIFVDGFSFCDKKTAEDIVNRLKSSSHQIISLTSPGSARVKELIQ
ncbi:MAG: hypothetical protein IJV00_00465 [Clostridia bacterium]|nr:hypothetical protein [Clostridia bacterium]